jgi:hypothetical protein
MGQNSIVEKVSTVQQYPFFIDENDLQFLEKPCAKDEILSILKGFSKDKSPRLDGWMVEFFLR